MIIQCCRYSNQNYSKSDQSSEDEKFDQSVNKDETYSWKNLYDNTSKDCSGPRKMPKREPSIIRTKREKELSSNSISLAKNRVMFDKNNRIRTSNLLFSSVNAPEEAYGAEEYEKEKFEPHKYYQEVDSSAAIMKNRKTREVYYKNRKRKVDRDKKYNPKGQDNSEYEDGGNIVEPQPQEPREYEGLEY